MLRSRRSLALAVALVVGVPRAPRVRASAGALAVLGRCGSLTVARPALSPPCSGGGSRPAKCPPLGGCRAVARFRCPLGRCGSLGALAPSLGGGRRLFLLVRCSGCASGYGGALSAPFGGCAPLSRAWSPPLPCFPLLLSGGAGVGGSRRCRLLAAGLSARLPLVAAARCRACPRSSAAAPWAAASAAAFCRVVAAAFFGVGARWALGARCAPGATHGRFGSLTGSRRVTMVWLFMPTASLRHSLP